MKMRPCQHKPRSKALILDKTQFLHKVEKNSHLLHTLYGFSYIVFRLYEKRVVGEKIILCTIIFSYLLFFHTGTVLHEMLHAMGFSHEQSRTDRDQYVRIITRNIQQGRFSFFFFFF